MPTRFLCITVRFLHPIAHGRGEMGVPEWPPSPLRLFQALVAAAAARWNERERLQSAVESFRWLESFGPPLVFAGRGVPSNSPYRLYVPDNVADKVANSWKLGNNADISSFRTEKDVRSTHLAANTVVFAYTMPDEFEFSNHHFEIIRDSARSITHLGWGVDTVIGNAELLTGDQTLELDGDRWEVASDKSLTQLRVPVVGTLDALIRRHDAFLHRLSFEGFRPVPPLTEFATVGYRRASDIPHRPYVVFQLVAPDGRSFSYPQERLIHIHGMVRHLAIESMKHACPSGTPANWVASYVRGKVQPGEVMHRQFSYIPLPSIGHVHVDPSIRRMMITAPPGDGNWLKFLCDRLQGQQLRPDPERGPYLPHAPLLIRSTSNAVTNHYLRLSKSWASVTPVILPGFDDGNSAKTKKLIKKALIQSGIEVPCEFEWRSISWFPKSHTAHKSDKHGHPIGYIRPTHLMQQSSVHLRLRFEQECHGPLTLGAGRHCGFGLMAACDFREDD